MTQKKTFVIVAGYWSTNIGNSFFQVGAEYLFKKAFPNDRVVVLSDQPGYWNVRLGNPPNALDYLRYVEMDYLVIQGPYLRSEYPRIWEQTLRSLVSKGVKIIVVSAGMMDYSDETIKKARQWLKDIAPVVFITRDRQTFQYFGDLIPFAMDGIDVATFVSDIYEPIKTSLPPYVVFNFDQIPEPKIITTRQSNPGINGKPIQFNGMTFDFQFPEREVAISRKFKVFPFLRSLLPFKAKKPNHLAEHLIVRTDHRFNPMWINKSYSFPNSFVSDIPQTYLNIYANTEATFSNRVHACVATLAYGKSAMLFSKSPRAYLLERLGAENIKTGLTKIDTEWLHKEKLAMITFLRETLS